MRAAGVLTVFAGLPCGGKMLGNSMLAEIVWLRLMKF
jgi:hypothetical protein